MISTSSRENGADQSRLTDSPISDLGAASGPRDEVSSVRRWFRRTHPSARYWEGALSPSAASLSAPFVEVAPALPRVVPTVLSASQVLDSLERQTMPSSVERPSERSSLSPQLALGAVVAGRYEIVAHIGSGNFAAVYKARDQELSGHMVALKLQHRPANSERNRAAALRELQLLASVMHPSIVQFQDHGWHEARFWFVMPFYEGETLEKRIHRRPLTCAEARRIFEPLAGALAVLHDAGIRHQDIKPENIFLAKIRGFSGDDAAGIFPVLLDFGVAACGPERLIAGTPAYFAPEVAANFSTASSEAVATSKADVFSLALCLRNALEASAETVPGEVLDVHSFVRRRADYRPVLLRASRLRFLNPWLQRWLHPDPRLRPTADELSKQLAVLTLPEERRRRRRAAMFWVVPVVLALSAAFGAAIHQLQQRLQRQGKATERALDAEAELRADLQGSKREQLALQGAVENLRQRYDHSRMSQQELADSLARIEAHSQQLQRNLEDGHQRRQALLVQLQQEQRKHAEVGEKLADVRESLESMRHAWQAERKQRERLESALADARQSADEAQKLAAAGQRQAREAEAELAVSRQEASALRRSNDALEETRQELESDLVDALNRLEKSRATAARGRVAP